MHWREANAPREGVAWPEAVAFCRWLDTRLRNQGHVVSDRQLRLPTELEWQQAATGGDPEHTHPWGPDWAAHALNAEGTIGRTSAVGIYQQGVSPVGALDMVGNCWEWCLNPHDDPTAFALEGDDKRALRGGSWITDQVNCRAACCLIAAPGYRNDDVGFRVCLSSPIAGY